MPKFSLSGLFSGGALGAKAGAATGNPWITGLGGLAGGLAGGLFGNVGSKDPKWKKHSSFDPGQQAGFSDFLNRMQGAGQGYGQAQGLLQQYLDPNSDLYRNFEAPYMRQFNEQIVPRLGEQFASIGGGNPFSGALSSSGFGQALGSAGAGLMENLARLKSEGQLGAANQLSQNYNQMASSAFGAQPFQYEQRPGRISPIQGLLSSAMEDFSYAGLWDQLSGMMGDNQPGVRSMAQITRG